MWQVEIIKLPTRGCLLEDQSWSENSHILWSDGNHFSQQQGSYISLKERIRKPDPGWFFKNGDIGKVLSYF